MFFCANSYFCCSYVLLIEICFSYEKIMVHPKYFMYFYIFYVFYAILYHHFSHRNSQSNNPTICHHSLHYRFTLSHCDITRFSSRWRKLLVRGVPLLIAILLDISFAMSFPRFGISLRVVKIRTGNDVHQFPPIW
jgi:hypothetical protein